MKININIKISIKSWINMINGKKFPKFKIVVAHHENPWDQRFVMKSTKWTLKG